MFETVLFFSLTDFDMRMELSTYDYDYSNYSDDPISPAPPCSLEGVNYLGARLSILFYFMFLFSVFGNGLVLVIIHR